MAATLTDPELQMRDVAVTRRVGQQRLAVGLLQGALLYAQYQLLQGGAWRGQWPYLLYPAMMVSLVLPPLLVSGLGHMTRRQLALWLCGAVAILAVLALHDTWRTQGGPAGQVLGPGAGAATVSVLFFYIAHSLVMAGARAGRRVASYAAYFEVAWKLYIQLAFSAFFVLAVWLVLLLGASLFALVGIKLLDDIMRQSWFVVPVVCFSFSCAMHVTDVRPAIVRGIRTLMLVLLSWVLPVAVLLVGGFLASLPFTGLQVLWATRHATSVLLSASAVLVVLVNAAYQAGDGHAQAARMVRIAARAACLLLLPLACIAVHALGLRIRQYGWTAERVLASAGLLVALFYALGYGWSALRGGEWLSGLRHINVAAAWLVLAVLLALYTPLADPDRIGVNDQVARLAANQVAPDKFDYEYLRHGASRYGWQALEQLARHGAGAQPALVQEQARAAQQRRYVGDDARVPAPLDITANLAVWPKGAQLPASFPMVGWHKHPYKGVLPRCLLRKELLCDAFVLDLDGDGQQDVMLVGQSGDGGVAVLAEKDGVWSVAWWADHDVAGCQPLLDKLRAGQFEMVAPARRDIVVGGQRIPFEAPPLYARRGRFCEGFSAP